MLINGVNINTVGAILYDRVLKSNNVNTYEEWLDGDIKPTFIRQQDTFKDIELTFLFLGNDEEEATINISKLTQMIKRCVIQFDDMALQFQVSMIGKAEPKRLKNGNFTVKYKLTSDYGLGNREIYTTDANLTNSFKLTILYYMNTTTLLATETKTIRASAFKENTTLSDLGINVDMYQPEYYNHGKASNLNNIELTYNNLLNLQTLIINYTPIQYNLAVNYYVGQNGLYTETLNATFTFTKDDLTGLTSIGQLINTQNYKPTGYGTRIDFTGDLTVENILAKAPICVYYDEIENERSKNITILYYNENDEGTYDLYHSAIFSVRESQYYQGYRLKDLIQIQAQKPSQLYYDNGFIEGYTGEEVITYDTTNLSYTIKYPRLTNTVYVEYYLGTYPSWNRITTISNRSKYKSTYEDDFDITDLGIDLNQYKLEEYNNGIIYNSENFTTYEDVITMGVIQIYYIPIDYTIGVNFYTGDTSSTPTTITITINSLDFLTEPVLTDLIPINDYKPEGYQLDTANSYNGYLTLEALIQASPITIVFEEIEADKTKNIIIRYKQELSSTQSTLNTSLITINESDCIGGVRLKDIINLNAYKPDYYEDGIVDGASSTALLLFDDLESAYNVLYVASTYSTPIKYYTTSVSNDSWLGTATITYKIIDFEVSTTLYDLGLDLNAYKPSYCGDGELQYTGAVNFVALRAVESINVVYPVEQQPLPDDGIDYPHRFLFLQHNDLGQWEVNHPTWTMNHAYINTGVVCNDMSKLTVVMECARVDENTPLYEVNKGNAYLFGSISPSGSYYMRYNNQTKHGVNLSGVNLYEAKAGYYTNTLSLTEQSAIGWSETSGIYSSSRPGYSYATFTYTNSLQSEEAQMPYPLYLFACNQAGNYLGGLGGIGIYGCRIYYDDQLIRDYIPVQTYDKIGNLVAPSNCLYDKVSKSFFEDATGLNSFNIWDDDRYEDDNPDHKIGYCYVNYYKGDTFINTVMYYFRASDFLGNNQFDAYDKFMVDELQPAYYGPGEITNFDNETFDFANMSNNTYNVVYPALDNYITVNYYFDEIGEGHLYKSETIGLTERDFYQSPTFGDIVRLNKYRDANWNNKVYPSAQYETNFQYGGDKVTLNRLMTNSPYDILYTPASEVESYTFDLVLLKQEYGVRNYVEFQRIEVSIPSPAFRDGEYIDFYISTQVLENYMPDYYDRWEFYGFYPMDERLTTPDMLKPEYKVLFRPEEFEVPVNYYTDEVDDANLVASTSWIIKIDDFDFTYSIGLIDQLPNNFINKFRPGNCGGGVLQNTNTTYTSFHDMYEDLMTNGINIVYETVEEPSDPESAVYEPKMLYFGDPWENRLACDQTEVGVMLGRSYGAKIPYIDLGYKPKDLSRLRVELTGYCVPYGIHTNSLNSFSELTHDFTGFFGYWGAPSLSDLTVTTYASGIQVELNEGLTANQYAKENLNGLYSKGGFALFPRLPVATGWVYTAEGPQYIDGQNYYYGGASVAGAVDNVFYIKPGMYSYYRRGFSYDTDLDYEPVDVFHTYGMQATYNMEDYTKGNNSWYCVTDGFMQDTHTIEEFPETSNAMANPFTFIMDAYNNYMSVYTYANSNTPFIYQFENEDNDIFEDREQPRGSLTLFRTRNPYTGNMNIMPFDFYSYADVQNAYGAGYGLALSGSGLNKNPYNNEGDAFSIVIETMVLVNSAVPGGGNKTPPGATEGGGAQGSSREDDNIAESGQVLVPEYTKKTVSININYMSYKFPTFPQIKSCAIWGLKIYDQDRLVRNLIPVAKDDVIYNYTMPANGLFDLETEIFFGNANEGGTYQYTNTGGATTTVTIKPEDVLPLQCVADPMIYGKITTNYYDYDNTYLGHQFVNVPTWFDSRNTTIEAELKYNDYKPDDFHLDGMLDLDVDLSFEDLTLAEIYEMGTANVFYKLRTFTKTIVYYKDNVRVGSRDIFYSLEDIENATTIADLGIDVDLYYDPYFKHGRVVFDESILASDDIEDFINAPSPIVVYDKYSINERPDLLYVAYYRGGASDDTLITQSTNPNYLNCNLTAKVLNPNGAIKYYNHYHQALYEDETNDYFIPYQVRVVNHYTGIHAGPGRMYKVLANIVERDTYTIQEVRNKWGRLKEYAGGWILLNQTEPITGPGQNPDYDVAGQDIATIPFAENITVTQLTIDRLWCWVPAVDSWVKAEDISFDQSGRLFNGLSIEVINLYDIDFSQVNSLADMGIDPEKLAMRFHDPCGYTYSGPYTFEAFTDMHELDFIYPETVYNYSCIYYQYIRLPNFEVGRSAFSCTISDWNPDWDIFLATSWQTDENDLPIDPTLYRDTEVVLNWDYFGFDNNLYKRPGWGDGIYLWNPRTWNKDNVEFTFRELIRCGTQYVIYPVIGYGNYKLWIRRNSLCDSYLGGSSWGTGDLQYYCSNPGIKLDLSNGIDEYFNGIQGPYDVYIEGELYRSEDPALYAPMNATSRGTMTNYEVVAHNYDYSKEYFDNGNVNFNYPSFTTPFGTINGANSKYVDIFKNYKEGDRFVLNYSNHRDTPRLMVGLASGTEDYTYWYFDDEYELHEITKTTNLNRGDGNLTAESNNVENNLFYLTPPTENTTYLYTTYVPTGVSSNIHIMNQKRYTPIGYTNGIIYSIRVYDENMMIHNWVPVPQGMYYITPEGDGYFTSNGLYDLITNEFRCSYKVGDGNVFYIKYNAEDFSYWDLQYDGIDDIYLTTDDVKSDNAFNLYEGWSFNSTDCLYLIELNQDTRTFQQPNIYSTYVRTLPAGLVVPVSKYTSDGANGVSGEWYYSCGQWFQSNAGSISSNYTVSNLRENNCKMVILPQHQCLLKPGGQNNQVITSPYTNPPVVANSYYLYNRDGYVFNGFCWLSTYYTSVGLGIFIYYEADPTIQYRQYAITQTCYYYTVPIADDKYIGGRHLYGERINVPYYLWANPNWLYTGKGWIQKEGNTSLVE